MMKTVCFCVLLVLQHSIARTDELEESIKSLLRALKDDTQEHGYSARSTGSVTHDSDNDLVPITPYQSLNHQSKDIIEIAAFNIQVFGVTKYKKQGVVDVLLSILKRYDLILVQEIRDKEDSFESLVDELRKETGYSWEFVIGPRLGRSNSKEQYAYLYRGDKMSLLDSYTYSDTNDYFEREPMCTLFSIPGSAVEKIGFIGIHTKPDDAVKEIDHLYDVYEQATGKWETENIVMMGDFNGDCSYVLQSEWPSIRLRTDKRFRWLLGDGIDTTTKDSNCAYDRIVVGGADLQAAVVPLSGKAFHYHEVFKLSEDMTEDVSDHYPVHFSLYGKLDEDVVSHISVAKSFSVHCSKPGSKTNLKTLSNEETVAGFEIVALKAGRGIRTLTAFKIEVDDVKAALIEFQKQYPDLMSDIAIGTVESFMKTELLKGTNRVAGLPGKDPTSYDVRIEYSGKTVEYDVIVSKNMV